MRKEKIEELKGYIEELKTIKVTEDIKNNKNFLNIKKNSYLLNNGETIIREELIKDKSKGDAICILPVTDDFNVILVVQPRPLTKDSVTIELPAGYVDLNESPEVAALRELREETGYASFDIKEVSTHYQDQGCSKAIIHSFIAMNCKQVDIQALDESEYIRYFICTYNEAIELMEQGYIMDANSIITIEKSKKYIGGKHV